MGRETRSAIQLRAMVQVRLNALPEVIDMKAKSPSAGPIAGAVLPELNDPQGRTWDIRDLFQGAATRSCSERSSTNCVTATT